jgi:tripartite-type tricarboxylate transporter receptor subunit TctC
MTRRLSLLLLVVICLVGGTAATFAQDYPNRPIRLIVPFGAGGPGDLVARVMAQHLSEKLGQPVVIDSRPGAGGNLGTQAAINAPADGYTLLLVTHTNAINATLYRNLSFNFLNDTIAIGGMVRVPNVMEVTPSLPVNNVAEFIAYAKANPGKVNYSSGGNGTSSHLAAEMFKSMTGLDLVHVPYRGNTGSMTDLMAGRVQLTFGMLPSSIGHIRSGKLRAIGVTSAKRASVLPDVPAIAETVPGFELSGWFGIGAPKGTPAAIVERINREINAGLADPKVKARFDDFNAEAMSGSAAEFRKFIEDETEKWARVVKFSGAKVD